MHDDNTMSVIKNPSRWAVVALGVLTAAAWADDFLTAYSRKDFKAALKQVRPLAEEGNAYAQFTIGKMYANGEGISRDFKKAAQWFHKASEQGIALAQYQLGRLYAGGAGVEKNMAEAARTLHAVPGALHLRTLQSINDISSDQSNTVVFTVPLEIMQAFTGYKKENKPN